MIHRICTKCPGCDEGIALRISIGRSSSQPFYYVCSTCNTSIRGSLIITPGNIDVQIEVGELVQADLNTEQVYAIDPILPTPAGARSMDDEGGPPFLFNLGNTICSLDVLPISALRYHIFKPQNVLILLSNHQPHQRKQAFPGPGKYRLRQPRGNSQQQDF